MDIILLIRIILFATFLLLVIEGIAALIIGRKFYLLYIRKHLELEKRVDAIERRLSVLEQEHHA